jgi:hypothetical protein
LRESASGKSGHCRPVCLHLCFFLSSFVFSPFAGGTTGHHGLPFLIVSSRRHTRQRYATEKRSRKKKVICSVKSEQNQIKMVDRVGDWYAFSRTSFCRRLTLYEDLPWSSPTRSLGSQKAVEEMGADLSPSFTLAAAELVAMAPFGGLIAVLSRGVDGAMSTKPFSLIDASPSQSSSPSPFYLSSPDGSKRPYLNLSAHSAASAAAAAASRAIFVFTNAGELLARLPITPQDVGQELIRTLGWTPEGELFFLLEPSLTVVFVDMGDVAVEAVGSSASSAQKRGSHRAVTKPVASRRVCLKPKSEVVANPTSDAAPSCLAAFCVVTEGLLCVAGSGSGQLYGLLHEEKFCSSLVPPVRLPLQRLSVLQQAGAVGAGSKSVADLVALPTPRVTAIDMVPPAWNDSGDFLVLWAQCNEAGSAKGKKVSETEVTSTVCAMVLPDSDLLDCDGCVDIDGSNAAPAAAAVVTPPAPTWSAAYITCAGRVLNVSVCAGDPTRVAAFTSLGVLHVFRSNLSATLYAIDLGLCRVMRDMAVNVGITSMDGDGEHDNGGGLFSHSFAFGDALWRQRDVKVGSNASFAGERSISGGGGDVGATGSSLSHSSRPVENGDEQESRPSLSESAAAWRTGVACPSPSKLEWCGSNFVFLHFYQSDFQPPHASGAGNGRAGFEAALQRSDAPMFSLLVCIQKGCSVHCERLNWSLDGSGHIASVAEADGVRVVSDTTCYFVQEVPPCLARLCRVQPPFSAAALVVQAYQAYMNGDRHGIAQVRAALSSSAAAHALPVDPSVQAGDDTGGKVINDDDFADDDDGGGGDDGEEQMSYAEGVVYELLDAASYECDVDRQYLLIAAASFAGETIHLRSGVPDVIVDVVRRLRVLRAIREEVCCHMPLTMGQYQVLTGSEERPARLLSSLEGSVLVDRLAFLGYYQLALDVVRALHMKPNRVLSRWASSFVRRHIAELSDVALHHEVTQVLREYPGASYIEPATTAFHLGRRDLALRLLRDEPQQQRQRVMLCLKMGELAMASRAAAASGSADLIHLVVCALVAKEAETHQREASRAGDGEGQTTTTTTGVTADRELQHDADNVETSTPTGVTVSDVYHCLIASPELLCWLLVGAQSLAAWQSMSQRLLLSRHWSLASLECQQMLVQCLRLSSVMHRKQLQQYMAETAIAGGQRRGNVADSEQSPGDVKSRAEQQQQQTNSQKKNRKKDQKHRRHKKGVAGGSDGNSGSSDDDSQSAGDEDRAATPTPEVKPLSPPPPLSIPVPTALGAAVAVTEWMHRTNAALLSNLQHAEELRREDSAMRYPFSVIVEHAEKLRADARKAVKQFTDSTTSTSVTKSRSGTTGVAGDEETGGAVAGATTVLSQAYCIGTVLSTPFSTPKRDAAALRMEQVLNQLRVSLAVKYNTPRLSRVVSVVDLIYELCGIEGGETDAADVQRTFKVHNKMFCYAKLRGMCAAQRWAAVDDFLGAPPPLRRRSFFSVGEGGTAKMPCIGYLPVVQLLTQYKQEERAARYVAGACSEAVDRVVLYMSLGAPVMALEAAMADRDAGLIQQIMQRVPGSAKVQSVGTQMLNELREN